MYSKYPHTSTFKSFNLKYFRNLIVEIDFTKPTKQLNILIFSSCVIKSRVFSICCNINFCTEISCNKPTVPKISKKVSIQKKIGFSKKKNTFFKSINNYLYVLMVDICLS